MHGESYSLCDLRLFIICIGINLGCTQLNALLLKYGYVAIGVLTCFDREGNVTP